MELIKAEWLGTWESFENYICSTEDTMVRTWQEAENAAKVMKSPMFAQGVKAFWQMACSTVTPENPVRLGGWQITDEETGISIEWRDTNGNSLGKQGYVVERIIDEGLEGKPNYLFHAVDAPEGWPFAWMLAMEPMPKRNAHLNGAYLSHLHFQFSGSIQKLLNGDGTLVNPHWYATMCAAEGALLDRCNIVRGLHKLPKWTELPI